MSEQDQPGSSDNDEQPTQDAAPLDSAVPPPSKTPLYQAFHAARYQRQALIKDIQKATGRTLICYVAGMSAPVDREDVVGFVDLLHNVPPDRDIDLLLHTGGVISMPQRS